MAAAGIRGEQGGSDGVRWFAGAKPGHAVQRVHRVDQRLRGKCSQAALHMDRQRTDREEARRDRGAQRTGRRVARQNGPCHGRASLPLRRLAATGLGFAMQPNVPITTDLVLLGAGHAHVEVLRRFAMRREPGVRLTLIGREPETPYSGMLPGLIRGEYTFDEAHIDLAPLAAGAGARLILAE